MKKMLAVLLALVMVLGAVACTNTTNPTANTPTEKPADVQATEKPAEQPTEKPDVPEVPWDGVYMDRDDFRAYTVHDLDLILGAVEDQLDDATYANVKAAKEAGEEAVNAALEE